jgi:hypothetical protein
MEAKEDRLEKLKSKSKSQPEWEIDQAVMEDDK